MKRVLITGSSRGIGKAIADLFRERGWEVLAPTRKEMDLSDSHSISNYCAAIDVTIDAIINNAGINNIATLDKLNEELFGEMLQVNLKAPVQIVRCLQDKLKMNTIAHVVNVSSIWGFVSKEGRLGYAAAKTGIIGATRTMALELGRDNVLVNAVAPGFVNTELTKQNNTPEQIAEIESKLPLGRMAEPEEIAKFVYFLASDENTFITGQTILIDGGYTCQ
jgi:3-oxoacyl-[acyl-carrier protein] reductase